MNQSLSIGKYFGIPVKVHWTFGLLILFVTYVVVDNNIPTSDIPWFFAVILIMFFFVILHEYGHALTARRFGVHTRDIIISPIGGVARLESIPKIAKHELLIAIAGPMVNVALALAFWVLLWALGYYYLPQTERINLIEAPNDFLAYLFSINVALIFFNMIPAFPMDGGRVLRSLLAMMYKNHNKATKIASYIGQVLAVGFLLIGAYYDHYVLLFIGIFVFMAARSERRHVAYEQRMSDTKVGEIALTRYHRLHPDDSISTTEKYQKEGGFFVFDDDGQIVGALPALFIKDAKENGYMDDPISTHMSQRYGFLSEGMNLKTAFSAMNEYGWAIAAIVDESQNIKGVIDRRLLLNFLKKI